MAMFENASQGIASPTVKSKAQEKYANEKTKQLKDKKDNKLKEAPVEDSGAVLGSFSLSYPATSMEKEREDGTTIINYAPETRVFICGGEVTKDVVSVSVNYTAENMSTCHITLANPRGKYNISISDLVAGKNGSLWREDKSIQATYDYDWLKKQVPGNWTGKSKDTDMKKEESKMTRVGNTILGKQVTSTYSSVVSGIKNMSRNRQTGFTQMLFEVKQQSNIHKAVGETIFDYRDTVYVFFKGRFSSYWYFGFSGIVAAIDNSYTYGSQESITLQCHDVIGILKRKKFTQQGAIIAAANFEAAQNIVNNERVWNIWDDIQGNFSTVVKQVMFVSNKNYVNAVENSHFYYTDKCTLNTKDKSQETNEPTTPASGPNAPSEPKPSEVGSPNAPKALPQEPYDRENEIEYLNEFYNTHKFNTTHTDDKFRDNTGKQFREFQLKKSLIAGKEGEAKIIVSPITFKYGRALYIDDPPDTYYATNKDKVEARLIPANAEKQLLAYLDQMLEVSTNSKTPITWKVVGHVALITQHPITPKSAYSRSLRDYRNIDLGNENLMDYHGCFDRTFQCLDVPVGYSGDNSYKYYDGEGLTLSRERAKRVFRDLRTLAKGNEKYKTISSTLESMSESDVVGMGTKEPRNAQGEKVARVIPSSPEEFINLCNVVYEKLPEVEGPANANNRYIELVPSAYTYKTESTPKETDDSFVTDPHSLRFSPLTDMYFQLNEIDINNFTPENLEIFYKTSARYWLKGPGTTLDATSLGNSERTGWAHTHGFGVCGIHPAMTYDFIDNFNILPDVHSTTMSNLKQLDGVTLSPLDILREQVYGAPTEMSNSPLTSTSTSIGTQHNYFRPRIFLVLPKKFRDRERFVYKFSQFDLVKIQAVNTWEMLSKLTLEFEYTIYSSPMGDLFIEPLMHDFHPLDFHSKIEERSICNRKLNKDKGKYEYQGVDIFFRTVINTNSGSQIGYRKDKAYKFNTKANHPYFLTNKDLKRVTETLKPENLLSHVILQGSYTGKAGMQEAIFQELNNTAIPYIGIDENVQVIQKNSEISFQDRKSSDTSPLNVHMGIYVANGFSTLQPNQTDLTKSTEAELAHKLEIYKYKLYNNFTQYKQESTIGSIIISASQGIQKLINSSTVLYNTKIRELVDKYKQSSGYFNISLDTDMIVYSYQSRALDDKGLTVLYEIAPSLYELYKSSYNIERRSHSEAGSQLYSKPAILLDHNITSINGLLKLAINALTYKTQDVTLARSKQSNTELIQQFLNNIKNNDGEAYNSATIKILEDLLNLYEISLLSDGSEDTVDFRELSSDIHTLTNKLHSSGKMTGFVTRGDLKKYEALNLYDPAKDNVTKYGWNPGPSITNTFINNGAEAEIYCKVLFDKINSKVYELNCDIIGRPEIWLNRPYYVEKNVCIGLCTDYSISYAIGTSFSSNVKLTYVRRNAIAYSYNLDNLDRVSSFAEDNSTTSRNNKYFNEKALNYYKSVFDKDKSKDRNNVVNSVVSKSTSAGPLGAVIGGVAQELLKKKKNKDKEQLLLEEDGIYVAHDWIGHTDFDSKYGVLNRTYFTEKIISSSNADAKYVAQLGGHLIQRSDSQSIVTRNNELHTAFMILQNIEMEYEAHASKIARLQDIDKIYQQDLLSVTEKLLSGQHTNAEPSLIRESDRLTVKITENYSYIESAKSSKTKLDNDYKILTKQIYGAEGTYSPEASSSGTLINYQPSAMRRTCKWNPTVINCSMTYLYNAIPERDINGISLRAQCEIIDDTVVASSATVTGKDEGVPLYINMTLLGVDASNTPSTQNA